MYETSEVGRQKNKTLFFKFFLTIIIFCNEIGLLILLEISFDILELSSLNIPQNVQISSEKYLKFENSNRPFKHSE